MNKPFQINYHGNHVVISGDFRSGTQLSEEKDEIISYVKHTKLPIVDLYGITFMDSDSMRLVAELEDWAILNWNEDSYVYSRYTDFIVGEGDFKAHDK